MWILTKNQKCCSNILAMFCDMPYSLDILIVPIRGLKHKRQLSGDICILDPISFNGLIFYSISLVFFFDCRTNISITKIFVCSSQMSKQLFKDRTRFTGVYIVTVGLVVEFKFNYFLQNSVEIYFDATFGSESIEASDDLMFQVKRLNRVPSQQCERAIKPT